jgi:hypothetical protein
LHDGLRDILHIKTDEESHGKIWRWRTVNAFCGGDGLPHRGVPARIPGAFLPDGVTYLPLLINGDFNLGGVIIVGDSNRATPLGT